MTIKLYYILFVILQLIHSQEEIHTKFYKHWNIIPFTKNQFIVFEIVFSSLIILPIFISFPYSYVWMHFFIMLMFANGLHHFIWSDWGRKYVPGLISGLLYIPLFILYYFNLI